jgi:hypothetical protein
LHGHIIKPRKPPHGSHLMGWYMEKKAMFPIEFEIEKK